MQNIGYIAEYLTAVGIYLKEVGVVGDEERAIFDAINALRHRYTYVFATGGIGPTHGDITAGCVAKALGMPIHSDPRALAIRHEWVKTTDAEMNEARMRMTRIPKGTELILNKASGATGFCIGCVIVMAGVPSIMQAMLDEVARKLKIGACSRKRCAWTRARAMRLGEIASQSCGRDRELSVLRSADGRNANVVLRTRDAQKPGQAKRAVEDMLEILFEQQTANLVVDCESGGQEFESLWARHDDREVMLI